MGAAARFGALNLARFFGGGLVGFLQVCVTAAAAVLQGSDAAS